MELIKFDLMSKNNKDRGSYFYTPIVKIGNDYFRCRHIRATHPLKKADIDISYLQVSSKIQPEYYEANGLKPK